MHLVTFKDPTGRCEPLHMTGINFMGGESALPTNSEKSRTINHKINNAGHTSDDPTGENKSMLIGSVSTLNRTI